MIRSQSTFTFTGEELTLLFEVMTQSGYCADIFEQIISSIRQGAINVTRDKLRKLEDLHAKLAEADL